MCRVERKVYIGSDGQRRMFDENYLCEKARGGRLCAKPKTRTTQYNHNRGSTSRDDTPSPMNPPTPTGTGTYLVQKRRPSTSGSRPPTRDGQRAINPEIVIEFGSKKERGNKYSSVAVSNKGYKRTSLGASSVESNDVAIESPNSEASFTIRTGFPEAPLPPPTGFSQPNSYIPTPTVSHGYHHRHTSSGSSSRTPSLYVTSDPDYDPPMTQRTARHAPPIVHNPTTTAPPSPSRRQTGASSGSYRTSMVAPQGFSHEIPAQDGLYPLDYADFADRSASSHASSGAPENTRRAKSSDDRRKKKDEDRRRQEERDRQLADEVAKAETENVKQVRFELGRADGRAQERAERTLAEKEKDRAAAREEARQLKHEERLAQEKKELEEKMAKDRKKEKSKPPTTDYSTKRPAASRRTSSSMTSAQLAEQRRLLAADELHMQGEKEAAEARDREERNAAFRQQQETPGYYDPRGGDRSLSSTNNPPTMGRRNSMTRHDSVTTRPSGLTRSSSKRRTSISQPNPPPVNTQVPPDNYSTRPPSARTRAPPPLSFPANFNQDYSRPAPSARRASFTQENPFAAPPTRGSNSSLENPFAPVSGLLSPSASVTSDPWDLRTVETALPPAREGRYNSIQQRGEAVINRSTSQVRAQQASRAMGRAAGYADDYETDSDSVVEERTPVYASRTGLGLSGKGKKKY
ncbi:hypothetical protein BDW02DRAFT_650781 [Decorospora gaudefroyi]|uniref:Uncharacterized protein n=1 Tax=Decorospora gaudefroyi TaxID=184978 RepID=A0A6A5K625_9PLEO|nr:hypothetical protein BDW02DRAFT_650781 [Decorospora gaudefroyi]